MYVCMYVYMYKWVNIHIKVSSIKLIVYLNNYKIFNFVHLYNRPQYFSLSPDPSQMLHAGLSHLIFSCVASL